LINIILQETLTGFKWMGNKADQYLQEGEGKTVPVPVVAPTHVHLVKTR
jgi:hypothetical protein